MKACTVHSIFLKHVVLQQQHHLQGDMTTKQLREEWFSSLMPNTHAHCCLEDLAGLLESHV